MWIIWFAILNGLLVIYFVLSPKAPTQNESPLPLLLGFGLMVLSTIIRWFIVPIVKPPQLFLSTFVLGLAVAEAVGLVGIFIFPAFVKYLFPMSVLAILQYIPLLVRRF